jgi:hypothetical protein
MSFMKRFLTLLSLIGLLCTFGVQGATAEEISLTCAEGGVCHLGDIGPGGGMVFYVRSAESFNVWRQTPVAEKDMTFDPTGWKYLEVAPKTWAGGKNDPKLDWCNNHNAAATWTTDLQGFDYRWKWHAGKPETGYLAGTGFGNSETASKHCKTGAATAARNYQGGGKSDWYLPRMTELNQLVMFAGGKLHPTSACCLKDFPTKQSTSFKASVYGFNWSSVYWGSGFGFGKVPAENMGFDQIVFGTMFPSTSGLPYVRPIRAF